MSAYPLPVAGFPNIAATQVSNNIYTTFENFNLNEKIYVYSLCDLLKQTLFVTAN